MFHLRRRGARARARTRVKRGAVRRSCIGLGLFFAICSGAPSIAHAAGLYVTDRGVRPLGRGGAFVAGADDLGAVWYNPAGLADAGTSFLLDASYLHFASTYTAQAQVANTSGAKYSDSSPSTSGSNLFLPVPTVAF